MSEFFINIEHGAIVQKRLVRKKFDELPDGSYKIKILKGSRRTNKQNAYYWGVVVPLVFSGLRDLGFEKVIEEEDAHMVCKTLFLKEVEQHAAVKIEKTGSSRKLTSKEFNEYVDNITIWAFDYLNVSIPAPGQQLDIVY